MDSLGRKGSSAGLVPVGAPTAFRRSALAFAIVSRNAAEDLLTDDSVEEGCVRPSLDVWDACDDFREVEKIDAESVDWAEFVDNEDTSRRVCVLGMAGFLNKSSTAGRDLDDLAPYVLLAPIGLESGLASLFAAAG